MANKISSTAVADERHFRNSVRTKAEHRTSALGQEQTSDCCQTPGAAGLGAHSGVDQFKEQAEENALKYLKMVRLEQKVNAYRLSFQAAGSGSQSPVPWCSKAKILLLNEIMSALDPELAGEVLDVVRARDEGRHAHLRWLGAGSRGPTHHRGAVCLHLNTHTRSEIAMPARE